MSIFDREIRFGAIKVIATGAGVDSANQVVVFNPQEKGSKEAPDRSFEVTISTHIEGNPKLNNGTAFVVVDRLRYPQVSLRYLSTEGVTEDWQEVGVTVIHQKPV